jgi:hypothetical protein
MLVLRGEAANAARRTANGRRGCWVPFTLWRMYARERVDPWAANTLGAHDEENKGDAGDWKRACGGGEDKGDGVHEGETAGCGKGLRCAPTCRNALGRRGR